VGGDEDDAAEGSDDGSWGDVQGGFSSGADLGGGAAFIAAGGLAIGGGSRGKYGEGGTDEYENDSECGGRGDPFFAMKEVAAVDGENG